MKGEDPGLSWRTHLITQIFRSGEPFLFCRENDVNMEEGSEQCCIAGLQMKDRGHGPENRWPLEAGKGKAENSLLKPPGRNAALLLDSSPGKCVLGF